MRPPTTLRCRACGEVAPLDAGQSCLRCWGPLDLERQLAPGAVGRAEIVAGPPSMWRWGPLLAVPDPAPHLGVGATPLVPAPRLGAELGIDDLWLKDETVGPTGSFKDRLVLAALGRARQLGTPVAATASTGNLALSVAALAPHAGIAALVLVPADLPPPRRAALAAAGATVVPVAGSYDRVNRLAVELAAERPAWAWVNVDLRPWYVDGARPLAFEVAEQLGWAAPDHVVACMASGATIVQLHRGFAELRVLALTDPERPPPRVSVAQPAGCAPVVAALEAGVDRVEPVRPATAVATLAMGDPPDGDEVVALVRATGGAGAAVPEDEVAGAAALLARLEGIEVEPAGGVVVAALAQLAARGAIRPGERVVAYLTGGAHGPRPSVLPPPPGGAAPGVDLPVADPDVDAVLALLDGRPPPVGRG